MLKKTLVIWLVCLSAAYNFGEASILQFGPKLTIATLTLKLNTPDNANRQLNTPLGWQAGVFARLSLPIVSLQPELMFSKSGTIYDSQEKSHKLEFTNLELPVIFRFSILGIANLLIGPSFTYLLLAQETDKQATNSKNVSLDYKILHVGYQVGIGTDIGNFTIDLKYAGGLNNFAYRVFNIPATAKQNLWLLSIGFNLL